MEEEIRQLKEQIKELQEWKEEKMRQQISFPLDEASKNALGDVDVTGEGNATLTQTYTDDNAVSGGDTHTGPKAYIGTIIINFEGTNYEVPYIA